MPNASGQLQSVFVAEEFVEFPLQAGGDHAGLLRFGRQRPPNTLNRVATESLGVRLCRPGLPEVFPERGEVVRQVAIQGSRLPQTQPSLDQLRARLVLAS